MAKSVDSFYLDLIVVLVFSFGWIANIVTFAKSFQSLGEIAGFQFMQLIGIFVGHIGAVLGYISLFS